MKPLSGLDATFLHAETPSTPMNVVATIILEPLGDGSPVPFETIAQRVESRLPEIAPFRRRLLESPLGLEDPVWVEDPDFTPRDHLLRLRIDEPGGRTELAAVVAKAAATRLDRARPLWTMWVVEGLEERRTALVIKAHHAALDGVSGAALLLHLFDRPGDTEAEGPAAIEAPSRAETPSALPGFGERLRGGLARMPERSRGAVTALRTVGGALGGLARDLPARPGALAAQLAKLAEIGAPETPWNRPLSNRRAVAYARVQRDQIRRIRAVFGGTMNDILLAACTTALRDRLLDHGRPSDAPLVAAIPVSTRKLGDAPGGNHISAMLLDLPTQHEDPESCLEAVRFESQRAKLAHARFGGETLASLAALMPSILTRNLLDLYTRSGAAALHRPPCNVVISNVPGPKQAFGMCGARVRSLRPHGPLMEGTGLNITVMSYADSIDIGVLTCARALPDPAPVADAIAAVIERLAKRADRAQGDREGELTPVS